MIPIENIEDSGKFLCGIVIGFLDKISADSQLHCGLLYTDYSNQYKVTHLTWQNAQHFEDRFYVKGAKYTFIGMDLDQEFLEQVNEKCNRLEIAKLKEAQSISYNLCYEEGHFDNNEQLQLNGHHGLTCGTYVMSILKSLGIELLDRANWKFTEEDKKWQLTIVNQMRGWQNRHSEMMTKEQLSNLETELDKNCNRYKPRDVAVGAISEYKPIDYDTAQTIGKKLIEDILKLD